MKHPRKDWEYWQDGCKTMGWSKATGRSVAAGFDSWPTDLTPDKPAAHEMRWALCEAAQAERQSADRLVQVSDDGLEWLIELGFQLA